MKNKTNSVYRSSYIITMVLFAIILLLCSGLFYSVTYQVSSMVLNFMRVTAYIAALVCAAALCFKCAKVHKAKNPDIFTPPRDSVYYFKRMGFFVLMIVLMNLAASMVGMVVATFIGGIFYAIENPFLSEFLLKLPVFVLYLSFVYKMLVRFGFMDSQRKIFNFNFKLITVMISCIIMLPGLVYDNYFYRRIFDGGSLNAQAVLSPNIGIYIIENDGFFYINENFTAFNIISIALTVIAAFAVQIAVFSFAYNRGKQIFIKQHLREIDYQMDENI